MRVLLIIPSYNEEANIEKNVSNIMAYKAKLNKEQPDIELDYIIINDCSTDRTPEIIREKHYNAIHLVCNLGIGGAVQTGYKYALLHDYDVAVQFDGDGQHDISSLMSLIQPIKDGAADFAVGSRFIDKKSSGFQTSGMRRFGIKIISALIKIVTGKRILDVTSGYRAANKAVIQYFSRVYPQSYPEPESIVHLMKKGYKTKEVPVNMFERTAGVSSISPLKSVTYMMDVSSSILIAAFMKGEYK